MKKHSVDLNSDLGEGFGPWRISNGIDEQLMPLISSANIATGFHAGDPNLMTYTVALAKEQGVSIGAHPGFRDLVGFGRREIKESAAGLVNDILYQIGAMREFASLHGMTLQHVKPHGALYMLAARDEALSRLLIESLQKTDPGLLLYCMESSVTFKVARELGYPIIREFYADRDYDRSGSIVFVRSAARPDPERVAEKVLRACIDGRVHTVEGDDIDIEFDSICIHSDTPGALEITQTVRKALAQHDIAVTAPGRSPRSSS